MQFSELTKTQWGKKTYKKKISLVLALIFHSFLVSKMSFQVPPGKYFWSCAAELAPWI